MTLKLRILRSLTRLFIILVSLTMSLFSEKMLIFNRCISGWMSNLIRKSWTVSNVNAPLYKLIWNMLWNYFQLQGYNLSLYLPLLKWVIFLFKGKLELLKHLTTRILETTSKIVEKIFRINNILFSLSSSVTK